MQIWTQDKEFSVAGFDNGQIFNYSQVMIGWKTNKDFFLFGAVSIPFGQCCCFWEGGTQRGSFDGVSFTGQKCINFHTTYRRLRVWHSSRVHWQTDVPTICFMLSCRRSSQALPRCPWREHHLNHYKRSHIQDASVRVDTATRSFVVKIFLNFDFDLPDLLTFKRGKVAAITVRRCLPFSWSCNSCSSFGWKLKLNVKRLMRLFLFFVTHKISPSWLSTYFHNCLYSATNSNKAPVFLLLSSFCAGSGGGSRNV